MATIAEFSVNYTPELRRSMALRLLWRTNGKWVAVGGAFLIVLGLLELALGQSFLGGLLIFLGVLNPATSLYIALARARRAALMDGEFHFVADDEAGLRATGPLIDQTLAWTGYRYAKRDAEYLYLHLARARAQVMPLAAGPGVATLCQWLERRGLLTTS